MQHETARTFLMQRQRAEGITSREMARRMEMDETTWAKVRSGCSPRRLTAGQILRACALYPDLRDLLFGREEAAS